MTHHNITEHQKKQLEVIAKIDKQIQDNNLQSSFVAPVEDFANDNRICLTSAHFLKPELINIIRQQIINPLKIVAPEHYYYEDDSLHVTVKNVRTISEAPHFSPQDEQMVKNIFEEIIQFHHSYKIYYYRLLLFPHNLALMGTTDPEQDAIILDLDTKLKEKGIEDDKRYINPRYFFANTTLARFNSVITDSFKKKVKEISDSLHIPAYSVDSVTLVTGNAAMKKRKELKTWILTG